MSAVKVWYLFNVHVFDDGICLKSLLHEENCLQECYPSSLLFGYLGSNVSEVRSLLFWEVTQHQLVVSSPGLLDLWRSDRLVVPKRRQLPMSSYLSVFWLVGSFPSGIVASHSIRCYITVSSSVSGDLLKSIVVEVFPLPFFSGYCSVKDVYYKLVMPNYMPCPMYAA